MSEWTVFVVLAAVVGFGITIITPIIKLNTTITKLTTVVDLLTANLKELTSDNSEVHKRLWEKSIELDKAIADHKGRMNIIEIGNKGGQISGYYNFKCHDGGDYCRAVGGNQTCCGN